MESWIDSYFESLIKADTETGQSEALALKRANFPEALYRFRSLERLAYALEELRDGYIFVSDPANFNDPYDSALSAQFERLRNRVLEKYGLEYDPNTESKFFESLDEAAKKDLEVQRGAEQLAFQGMFGGLLSVLYGPRAYSGGQDFSSSFRNLVRVGCFTTNPNSVVMWSHYANQHKGICIEFPGSSMLSNAEFFKLLHPVRYTERLFDLVQVISPLISEIEPDEVFSPGTPEFNADCYPILAACHKSSEWKYEDEWRLVFLDPAGRIEPEFSLEARDIKPSRIILGAKINKADEAAIKELAEKISVQTVNADLAKDRFKIEF